MSSDSISISERLVVATRALQDALDTARERDIQQILQIHPVLLQWFFGFRGYRCVIPQKRLGSEFVPDFLVGNMTSAGMHWIAVELESPKVRMFTKAGDPSRYLVHAIRQIQDWRAWLALNQVYASRPTTEHGLGLSGISSRIPGLILIGRRQYTSPETDALRRQMMADLQIQIRTYDSLIEDLTVNPLTPQSPAESLAEQDDQAAQLRRAYVLRRRREASQWAIKDK